MGSSGSSIDHNVHGLVKLRLVSAPSPVVNMVRRRLGPSTGPSEQEPDLSIVFTDALPTRGRLRFLGLNRAAYDDEHFYLLDHAGGRIRVDLSAVGERCELWCERGVTSLPHLVPMIGLRLLAKGHVLLHSSSFVFEDKGVLVAGWQKGGKTEMLLAFMSHGAAYVGNEWSIVSGDGVRGVGGILQMWDWHLRHLPRYWERIPRRDRQRLRLLRFYQRLYAAIPSRRASSHGVVRAALHQLSLDGAVSLLRQVRVSPERLFGEALWQGVAPLDHIFLATVGAADTSVLPVAPLTVVQRMVASQAHERRDLLAAYDHFRFAFPDRRNELLENAPELELRLLFQAFEGRAAHEISHPYPVALEDLYRAAGPFCS